MPRKQLVATCAFLLGLTHGASADPFLPVPPASFINYHVDTVHQLSEQIAVDAVVRGRLARHFHRSGPQMVDYVQKNLVLSYLKKAGSYRVACVTPHGHEYYVFQRLPQGTPVFALLSTGQPILKRACGNPLVSSLPAVVSSRMNLTVQNRVMRSGKPLLSEGPLETPAASVVVADSNLLGDTVLTAVPDLAAGDIGELGPFTRVASSLASIGDSFFGLPLAGLAALGATGLFASSHGATSSTNTVSPVSVVPPTSPPITDPISPAPELSAMSVYSVGIVGLVALGYAKRRKSAVPAG